MQRSENTRKNSVLNYKSAAPSGGATGAELAETRAWTEATLYFSAPGVELDFVAAALRRPFLVRNILAEM